MSVTVELRLSVPEAGLERPLYDALADELRADGFTVTISGGPDRWEFRGAPADVTGPIYDVAVFVGQYLAESALDALCKRVLRALSGRSRKRPITEVPIYGPRGEVLRLVKVPTTHE